MGHIQQDAKSQDQCCGYVYRLLAIGVEVVDIGGRLEARRVYARANVVPFLHE